MKLPEETKILEFRNSDSNDLIASVHEKDGEFTVAVEPITLRAIKADFAALRREDAKSLIPQKIAEIIILNCTDSLRYVPVTGKDFADTQARAGKAEEYLSFKNHQEHDWKLQQVVYSVVEELNRAQIQTKAPAPLTAETVYNQPKAVNVDQYDVFHAATDAVEARRAAAATAATSVVR